MQYKALSFLLKSEMFILVGLPICIIIVDKGNCINFCISAQFLIICRTVTCSFLVIIAVDELN